MRTRSLGFALLVATIALFGGASHAQTPVSGDITTTTWLNSGSPYRVTGTVTIPPGNTLTIEPGVDVLFDADVQFIVQGSVQAAGTEAQNIRFMNGTAPEWGGIRISGGAASTFQYVQLSGGKAEGTAPSNLGGALMVTGAGTSVNVSNCLFSGNTALHGGAVAFTTGGTGQFTATTFTGNTSTSWGGAVYITSAGAVSFSSCKFEGNTSGTSGGAVAVDQSTGLVSFQSTEFRANHAGSYSGVVELYGASGKVVTSTFTDCLIENNTAASDAMIYGENYSNTTITNCIFRNNTGNSHGAGLALYGANAFATVTGSVFANNTASRGAALSIKWYATLNATNCTFVGNSITETGLGGAVYTYYSTTVNLKNCVVWGNTPNQMYAQSTAINATYSDVQGGWGGTGNIDADPLFVSAATGDYRLQPASPCIDSGDPTTTDLDGTRADMGALALDPADYPDIIFARGTLYTQTWQTGKTVRVKDVVTVDPWDVLTIEPGVDVLFDADVQFIVAGGLRALGTQTDSVRFAKGAAPEWGGLRFVSGDTVSSWLSYARISEGHADGGAEPENRGGGIFVDGSGTRVTLNRVVVRDNHADNDGGGIFLSNYASVIATDCAIVDNTAEDSGGGFDIRSGATAEIARCVIARNVCVNGGGSAFLLVDEGPASSATITNCTITENRVLVGHGALWVGGSSWTTVSGSILWGDLPDEVFLNGGTTTISFSDVQGGYPGDGNINADPVFASTDPASPDFLRLATGSPCIDTGDPGAHPDPDGTRADMGVFPVNQLWTGDPASVSATVTTTTWSAANSPYRVTGTVFVPAGNTLTIEPGVEVFFDADVPFVVDGALSAAGTEASPIRFGPGTSYNWGGLKFTGGANTLEHVEITGVYVWGGQGLKPARAERLASRARPATTERPARQPRVARPARTARVAYNDPDFTGGAIVVLNPGTSLALTNSIINGNEGEDGGGIHVANGANLTAAGSEITDNYASCGGGVYLRDATASFENCDISHNTGYVAGGGLDIDNSNTPGAVSFVACLIDSNTSYTFGGGMEVYMPGLTLSLSDCIVSGNHTDFDGGALHLYGYYENETLLGTANVANCRFQFNSGDRGGAIHTDCPTAITRSLFVRNYAGVYNSQQEAYGGAVCVDFTGSATVEQCTFSDNIAYNPYGTGGNGIYWSESATVSVHNSIVWGEYGQLWGSGLPIYRPAAGAAAAPAKAANGVGSSVRFSDIADGFADLLEGCFSSDPLFVQPFNTYNPYAATDYRLQAGSPCINTGDPGGPSGPREPDGSVADMGAFWFDLTGTNILTGTEFSRTLTPGEWRVKNRVTIPAENVLTIPPGTDLVFDADAPLVVNGSLHAEGTSKRVGERIRFRTEMPLDTYNGTGYWGGVRFVNPTAQSLLKYVHISRAHSASEEFWGGGAVSVTNNAETRYSADLDHVDIFMCVGGIGGAVYVSNADMAITNGEFSHNQAQNGSGGGVYVDYLSAVTVDRTVLVANTSYGGGGGVYVGEEAHAALTNCTIVDNSAQYDGGNGVYCSNYGTASIVNSILWGAQGQVFGPGMARPAGSSAAALGKAAPAAPLTMRFNDIVDDMSWFDESNISLLPLFVEAGPVNYNLRLQAGSPCIGAGENGVDMGAFAFNASYLYGQLTNLHWTLQDSPYRLAGSVTVPEGATLVIDPGVEVLAAADAALVVEGTLTAAGTEAGKIYFRPDVDQARWGGIRITGGSHTIQWADISGVYVISGVGGQGVKPAAGDRAADEAAILEQLRATVRPPTAPETRPRLTKAERRAQRAARGSTGATSESSTPSRRPAFNVDYYEDAGGAVFVTDAQLTIANTSIHNNVSFFGAGINARGTSSVTATDCQITDNRAMLVGGGINVSYGATIDATGCVISGNKAFVGLEGGGVRLFNAEATLTNCQITGNSGGFGGGVYADGSSLTVSGGTINGNAVKTVADSYGYYDGGAGGGVYAYNSSVAISGGAISGNTAEGATDEYGEQIGGQGGGVYYESNYPEGAPVLAISNSTVTNNTGVVGGGLYVEAYGEEGGDGQSGYTPTVNITDCTISGNAATDSYGGGIEAPGGALTITNCVFTGNTSYWEGAAGDLYGASATISGCRFENNTAGASSGALWLETEATIEKSVFVGNKAVPRWTGGEGSGSTIAGAVYSSGYGSTSIDRCTFVANEAVQADGVVILPPGDALLNRSARTAQFAQFGGAVYTDGYLTILSSIFWGNGPDEAAVGDNGSLDIMGSNLLGEYDGELWNCISADPMFVDSAGGDFHLKLGSPCVNTGSVNSPLDPDGSRSDIGAFYFDLTGYVWGDLAGTWTRGTYRVGAPVWVPSGATLTMEPGVDVLFDADVPLLVEGSLQALGEEGEGNGIRFFPGVAPEWGGLFFAGQLGKPANAQAPVAKPVAVQGEGSSTLQYVEITGADGDGADPNADLGFFGMMGGGVRVLGTSVDISHSRIHGNQAMYGGGLAAMEGGIMLNSCIVENNAAHAGLGGGFIAVYGGLMANDTEFRNNTAVDTSGFFEGVGGGGGYVEASYAFLERCGFRGNTADGKGGGVMITNDPYYPSPVEFQNCLFSGNTAAAGGGAYAATPVQGVKPAIGLPDSLRAPLAARPAAFARTQQVPGTSFVNCTFSGNTATGAESGGPIAVKPAGTSDVLPITYGGGIVADGEFSLSSSIVWGNTPDQISMAIALPVTKPAGTAALPGITYSDVQMDEGMVWEGIGNISADPLFVDVQTADYRLTAYSPCINTGDPAGAPDPNGTRADMGAFPLEFRTGDVTMDGTISGQDASQVLQFSVKLIPSIPFALADVTNNGRATALDAAMILFKWLRLSLGEDFTFPLDEGYYNPAKLAIPASPRTLTWERSGSAWELRADNPEGLMAGEFAFNVGSDVALSAEAGQYYATNREGEIVRVAFARTDFTSPVLIRLVDDGRLLAPPSIASMELNEGMTPILRVVRPVEFALEQNTPNPFNPTTTIRFGLPVEGRVQLIVYDVTGRVVRTLVDAKMEAGVHSITWDGRDALGRDAASGTYIYRLVAPNGVLVKRMVMVK